MATREEYARLPLAQRLDRLERTPADLGDSVRGRSRDDVGRRPDAKSWSATEVFCHCDPRLASDRAMARIGHGRHPIHRDVINPEMAGRPAELAATVTPLRLGAALIEVDTGEPDATARAVTAVRSVLG